MSSYNYNGMRLTPASGPSDYSGGRVKKYYPKYRAPYVSKKNIQKMVSQQIERSAEHKQLDNYVTPAAPVNLNTSGTVDLINGCAEGTANVQRIGRDIKMIYLEIDFTVFLSIASIPQFDSGFISVVLDRQPDFAVAGFSSIYDTSVTAAGSALRNITLYPDRFKVLRRIEFNLDANGSTTFHQKLFVPLKYLKGMDSHVKFGGTTAAISSIGSNALYLTYGSNILQTTGNETKFFYTTRVRFIDI